MAGLFDIFNHSREDSRKGFLFGRRAPFLGAAPLLALILGAVFIKELQFALEARTGGLFGSRLGAFPKKRSESPPKSLLASQSSMKEATPTLRGSRPPRDGIP